MKTNQLQKNTKWVEKELGEVANFFNGKAHENDISDNGKYVVINSKFVSTNGRVAKYTDECLSPLKKGDVAMVMSDIPNGKAIAKCFLVDKDNKYTLNQRIGGFRSKEINSSFLYFLLNRNRYFLAFDDGVNQTNLRRDDILECPLYFPPLSEQNRIVSVLETWDNVIENLNKKIEIKKQIKKGLMQDLLTGKKRLAGFKDKWKTIKLGDVCKFQNGCPFESEDFSDSEGVRIIRNRDLKGDSQVIFFSGKNIPKQYLVENGDILIGMDGDFLACKWSKGKALLNQRVGRVINFKNSIKDFIFYKIQIPLQIIEKETSSTTVKHLSSGIFEKFNITIPNMDEQTSIANILTTADREIAELENKLFIIKNQKKFLLNNLITGAIRTPENLSVKK